MKLRGNGKFMITERIFMSLWDLKLQNARETNKYLKLRYYSLLGASKLF